MIDFDATLRAAARELASARRPAILVGPEAAPAAPLLLQMAERLGAAVFTTPDAKSAIDHWRSSGTFSFGASRGARRTIERADVVLAISALGEFSCRLGEAFRQHRLIQVTESVTEVGRNVEPTISLVGTSITNTVAQLCTELMRLVPTPRHDWFTELGAPSLEPLPEARPGVIHPIAAIAAVQSALPAEARVCLDVTSGALHAYERLRVTTAQRVFSSIENGACMSEALLASIGIRLASNLPTLALVGDWGFCMAPAELHTAIELELSRYVVLIWANSGGAFIGAGVEQQGIVVPDQVWRWRFPPDFAQVASGYGARGVTVTDAETLASELSRGLRGSGPMIIEAKIDPLVAVPAGDRFLTLGEARA
jgi:acetolactate synthase I/II/III large subunit